MADIQKCDNKECSLNITCWRFNAPSSEYNQAWGSIKPNKDSTCDFYYGTTGKILDEEINRVSKEKEMLIAELKIKLEISKSGYGGVLPTGEIVDRRVFPDAIPLQKNVMLNVPEPKEL